MAKKTKPEDQIAPVVAGFTDDDGESVLRNKALMRQTWALETLAAEAVKTNGILRSIHRALAPPAKAGAGEDGDAAAEEPEA